MDKGHLVRRMIHMMAPLFLVYYLVPDELFGVDKRIYLLVLLAIVLAFEVLRLSYGLRILGMRDYEGRRLSAFSWAAIGMVFAFLFFPVELAAPAVTGMAFIDPLIGELRFRKSKLYPALPLVLYFVIVLSIFVAFMGWGWQILLASLVGTVLAIWIEKMRTRHVDDDFLMMVVPLLGMAAVLYLTSSFPS